MRLPAMRLRMLFHKASAGRRSRDRHRLSNLCEVGICWWPPVGVRAIGKDPPVIAARGQEPMNFRASTLFEIDAKHFVFDKANPVTQINS
jgi:hypothetical protein